MKINQVIDLTHKIENGMTSFDAAWHPKPAIKPLGTIESVGRNTKEIIIGSHTGTHLDAPLHFIEQGASVDQIPLDSLIGKVVIVDFSHLKNNAEITREMLGEIEIGDKMIFNLGWSKYWNQPDFYKGYPFFSPRAAEYLIEKNVKIIAMDTPSPDDSRIKLSGENLGSAVDSPIHKMFLKSGVLLLEYLANLDKIVDYSCWSIAIAPLKIDGSDGSPARVFIFK